MSQQVSATHPALAKLYKTRKYSDLSIKCKDQTFLIHRAVVCPQSTYFDTLCDSDFKESQTGVVELKDEAIEDVERLISFFYTCDYNDGCVKTNSGRFKWNYVRSEQQKQHDWKADNTTSNTSEAADSDSASGSAGAYKFTSFCVEEALSSVLEAQLNNITMYALADKLDVAGLSEVVIKKFKSHAWIDWCDGAVLILREIYETTLRSNRGLRQAAIEFCTETIERGQELRENEDFVALSSEFPEVEADLLRDLLSKTTAQITARRAMLEKSYLATLKILGQAAPQTDVLLKYLRQDPHSILDSEVEERGMTGLSILQRISFCRHCHALFDSDWYFEGEGKKLNLRCGDCQTRHS